MHELHLIEELVNSRSVELGTDDLATPAALAAWLVQQGVGAGIGAVRDDDLDRVLVVREGLRALIARNNEDDRPSGADDVPDGVAPEALPRLEALASELPVVLDVLAEPPRLSPAGLRPVDALLARLLAAVAVAVADGSWARLKACRQPGCRWAYFDQSRNRSRAWCSMETCGNRAKARVFRERHRDAAR